jgi:hypothetical protein
VFDSTCFRFDPANLKVGTKFQTQRGFELQRPWGPSLQRMGPCALIVVPSHSFFQRVGKLWP